jgi:hypothetical protein
MGSTMMAPVVFCWIAVAIAVAMLAREAGRMFGGCDGSGSVLGRFSDLRIEP